MNTVLIAIIATAGQTQMYTFGFDNMTDCKIVEKSFPVKRKVRKPKSIYKNGGGSPLAYFECIAGKK